MRVHIGAMNRRLAEHVRAELRAEMGRQGLTGSDVAHRMGTYPQWINRRVNGKGRIDLDDLEAIARALNISAAQLVAGAAA